MPRFITNRWWTLILALVLGVGVVFAQPHRAFADNGSYLSNGDGGSGGAAPPTGNGDPDVPTAPTKGAGGRSFSPTLGLYGAQTVGDSRATQSALIWRLQVVMRMLRAFYFNQ
jgi:hypothetical protein